MKIFENWQKDLLSPVLVNISTAFILFLVALTFEPVRSMLFPSKEIEEYPLFCTAEAYKDSSNEKLIVDYYVINRTGEEYTREKLSALLKTLNPEPDRSLSPDIELKYSRSVGQIDTAYADRNFNDIKGDLKVEIDRNQRTKVVMIRINSIAPRAILKATIVVSGLPGFEKLEIHRTTEAAIPFNISDYKKKCYKG